MSEGEKRPDFLIIGAAKAGTTALFRALSRHPNIYCSPQKEPRFFAYAHTTPRYPCPGGEALAREIVTSEEEYFKLFSACSSGAMAGEASTVYFSSSKAPEEAFRYVPDVRLIAILRHPVERAYSQWLHLRRDGLEPLDDFQAAWAAEEARIKKGWRHVYHYRTRGFYGRQLERWLKFFPREQLLILFYEDWLERPLQTLEPVWNHLGVESVPEPLITRENVSSRQPRWGWLHQRMVEYNSPRRWAQRYLPLAARDAITGMVSAINLKPGPSLDSAVRAGLARAFHDDLRRVERLTGRDLNAWKK